MTPPREPDAIREAVGAGCSSAFDRLRDVWPGESPPDVTPIATAAIVAFLRALPGCDLRTPEDGDMTMDELAAAVERAAKEAAFCASLRAGLALGQALLHGAGRPRGSARPVDDDVREIAWGLTTSKTVRDAAWRWFVREELRVRAALEARDG